MKILYFYPEKKNDFMFYWQRVHFIEELGRSGIEFTIMNPLEFDSLDIAHEALLNEIKQNHYDLFFTSASLYVSREIISLIKSYGVPTLCFRPDNLLIPYIDKDIASSFDLVWLTSKETEYLYKKWGAKCFFAPYAANPYTFQPQNVNHINKLCFIGTPYGSRSNLINTIVNGGVEIDVFCKKSTENNDKTDSWVAKYEGPSMTWMQVLINNLRYHEGRKVLYANILNKCKKSILDDTSSNITFLPKVPFSELNNIYSSYAISLSSTSARNTDILSKPVNVINLRAFEIPMSGGLQLCRYCEELSNYFKEDEEIIFYRDNEELVDKAKFYTQNVKDVEIRLMKTAARKRAEHEHNWMNRFKIAFELLNLKY